jgi:hypothetical protein
MYNANKPSSDELPSSATLLRSTFFAVIGAGLILVMFVLPSEYGMDPTGVGGLLGLAEVGEIKVQLAAEADAERLLTESPAPPAVTLSAVSSPDPETRNDEITIELEPGEGAEVKLVMDEGDQAEFTWTANGSVLNYDQHGHGGGNSVSYEKGRGVAKDEGVMEAAFDGDHGWFWRNRTTANVQLTLRTNGVYLAFKRVL